MEGRGPAKGNTGEQNAPRTQRRTGAPSALDRVREAATKDRKKRFTALLHHVTIDRLRDAYLALKRRRRGRSRRRDVGASTAQDLEANLRDLHARLHRGAYRAKPSRRVYIPKADGRQRPLGIAALEDKIVQRAVVEVLNAIYETDFLGFSYGFRPGRSQHHALDALAVGILRKKVNWVLDADIRGFFDAIDHGWLVKFVEHRIADDEGRAAHPEMAERGRAGRREVDGSGGRDAAGSDDIAAAGERLPALRVRPVGPAVEEDATHAAT